MASVKWAELHKYSLVWVEFGNNKNDLDCDNDSSYDNGLNIGCEFCYRHMAIVVSNNIKSNEVTVVPLTSYKIGDEKYPSNVVIDIDKYGYMLRNKTTIKTNHIRSIDKKKRIKKIALKWISTPLKRKIRQAMLNNFK